MLSGVSQVVARAFSFVVSRAQSRSMNLGLFSFVDSRSRSATLDLVCRLSISFVDSRVALVSESRANARTCKRVNLSCLAPGNGINLLVCADPFRIKLSDVCRCLLLGSILILIFFLFFLPLTRTLFFSSSIFLSFVFPIFFLGIVFTRF